MSACLEIQPGLSMNQVGTIDHYTLIVECAETSQASMPMFSALSF